MAVFALGVVVAPVLGPTLGGWLTDTYSWRWAFYINIPIGILAVFMIMRYVQDPHYIRNAKPGRIDAIGLGLLAMWLGALQIVLEKAGRRLVRRTWIRWAAVFWWSSLVCFSDPRAEDRAALVDLRSFGTATSRWGASHRAVWRR